MPKQEPPVTELKIHGIPQQDTAVDKRWEAHPLKDLLPKPPFLGMFIGPIGSGKTSAAYTWAEQMRGYYDEIVVFSDTEDSKDGWLALKGKRRPRVVFGEYDEAACAEYLDLLKRDQLALMEEGKPALRILAIFDDCAALPITRQGRPTPVERACLVLRHELNLTILYLTQSIRSTTRLFRSQAAVVAMFRCSEEEQKRVAADFGGLLPTPGFCRMATSVLQQPFQFVLIERRASIPPLEMFRCGFSNERINVVPFLPEHQRRALDAPAGRCGAGGAQDAEAASAEKKGDRA